MNRITGSYPGGPRRDRDETSPSEDVREALTPAEELARARDARDLNEKRRARSRRVAWGFMLVLLLAGLGGFVTGLASHRTAADLAREGEAEARREKGMDLEGERRKILQELWKMEALERVPSPNSSGR